MMRPLDVDMGLHALGHLDTQEGEASGDRASDDFGECEAEGKQLFILLLEDGELVELHTAMGTYAARVSVVD